MEAEWTFYLAVSQLIAVPFFGAWRYLVKSDDGRKFEADHDLLGNKNFKDEKYDPWLKSS